MLAGFPFYLVNNYDVNEREIHQLLQEAQQKNIPFISYLAESSYLQSYQIANAVAHYFGLRYVDLTLYSVNKFTLPFDSALLHKYLILPLCEESGHMLLAISDPTMMNINEIAFLTGADFEVVIVEHDKLEKARKSLFINHHIQEWHWHHKLDNLHALNLAEEANDLLPDKDTDNSPIIQFVNELLSHAIGKEASDIHFEPHEKYYRIRYRIDGMLLDVYQLPVKFAPYITARLKIMASLDIAERRLPQDGRFSFMLLQQQIDFRLSTCPTIYGEKTVLRILKNNHALLNLDALGLSEQQKQYYLNALSYPQGMILVTGPTGSGKSITLYAALNLLNRPEVNIVSVEDPIEIKLPGVNQVQINPKIGLTFANVLRAFLRQDPDIIMLGEIRDQDTAQIAFRAAQTGHLVLATLHTNSASESISRLVSIGIPLYIIAGSLRLIIAQRLVRRLCDHCKTEIQINKSILLQEGLDLNAHRDLQIYGPRGCKYCHNGYKGRIGIFEILPISPTFAKLILADASALALQEQIKKESISLLRDEGLKMVIAGITSLDELNRVIRT